jgi:hypothetical protein
VVALRSAGCGGEPDRFRQVTVSRATHLRRSPIASTAARTALAGLVLLAVSTVAAASASASGDPGLDRYILKDPVPGWSPTAPAASQVVATSVAATVSSSTSENVIVAVDGWGDDAGSRPSELIIVLVRFPGSALPSEVTPSDLATTLCSSANASPGYLSPVSGIAQSDSESCRTRTLTADTAVAWEQANVAAFLYAAGLTTVKVDQIALEQSAAIPAAGISEPAFPVTLLAGAGAAAVALTVIAIVLVRRRRAGGAPSVAGGWPVQGGGQAAFSFASGFEGGAADAPLAAPMPSPRASAGPAPWSASGGLTAANEPDPGAYAPAPGAPYGQAAPYASRALAPSGNTSGAPVPYAPSRPSQRAAAVQSTDAGAQGVRQGSTVTAPRASAVAPRPASHLAPPPASPLAVGWYPVDGDPHRQRYWAGTGWTRRLRWNDSTWVDEP